MRGAQGPVSRDGALGAVALASPPLNLIGRQPISDLLPRSMRLKPQTAWALVLRGEGQVFTPEQISRPLCGDDRTRQRPLIGSFLDLGIASTGPFPTLAAVHGACMAGSLSGPVLRPDLGGRGHHAGAAQTRLGIFRWPAASAVAARAGLGRARSWRWAGSCIAEEFARGERSMRARRR